MYGVFQSAMKKWAESADSVGVQITDPNEKPVVDKFGVSRAPMPLVCGVGSQRCHHQRFSDQV